MRMTHKKAISVLVCIACILSLAACSQEMKASRSNFMLDYFDGSGVTNGYDTELLYRNDCKVWGGDSCVLYVSPEQSAEYGGWYYQYMSTNAYIDPTTSSFVGPDGKRYRQSTQILRSKDLVDWEICGAVDSGMGVLIAEDEWVWNLTWAPEVVYDQKTGKYFMYFSAQVRELNADLISKGARYKNYYNADGSHEWKSELNLGIAVSDSPVGPFRLVSSQNVYGSVNAKTPSGEVLSGINPPIMFSEHYEMDAEFSAIDLHPFFDENGDFYLYFVKHTSQSTADSGDSRISGNQIWAVKMLDMVTPDYASITKLVGNKNFVKISYKGDDPLAWDDQYPRNLDLSYDHSTAFPNGKEYDDKPTDGNVVEAPQVIMTKDKEGKTVYLLTYSVRGVGAYDYDVHFAYSYSPLGPFTKPQKSEGKTVLEFDASNDFASNLGHHDFVEVGDETWIIYGTLPVGVSVSGRAYAIDSLSWQWKRFEQEGGKTADILCPIANGPTKTLQPLMPAVSGYQNVAGKADVRVSSGKGTEYLNDGLVSTTEYLSKFEFATDKKNVEITLKFDEPQDIRGILIYNSYDYFTAFRSVDSIFFELAESPESYSKGNAKSCFITDLPINEWTVNEGSKTMRAGGGAVATFDEIKVSSITIKISDTVAGENSEGIAISDIYIIGK